MLVNTSPKKSVLIIGSVWPEPQSSAAGSRMVQLIQLFLSENYSIVFTSIAAESPYMIDLKSLGVIKAEIQLNDSTFDSFVSELNPTIVVFDRFMTEEQFGWRVAEHCPNTLRILDTEDLHCLRYARHHALKENRAFSLDDLVSDYSKREIASILRCDISLIISTYEMELLQHFFKVDKTLLLYVPFMLSPLNDFQIKQLKRFEERQHFISIGNFLHEPNWDAVQFLKNEIWPLIKQQLPETELHVYGAYPSQKVFELNNPKQGFIIKGRTDDAIEVMQRSKICLAPLRFGAGLKGKLIDAMIAGAPSITTAIGAEAMHENLPWSGSIEDSASTIAEAAIRLYTNKNLWLKAQENGIKIINICYPKKEFREQLINKINTVIADLKQHRLKNFTGAMLMHHTLMSTKYMSRWIEEKNKK
jgi:glycosyltransferase involved in cell wall biosynthesis